MDIEIIEHDELEIDMRDGTFVLDNDYKNIKNKPKINGIELNGNKTLEELGIQAAEEGKGLSTNDFDDNYKKKLDGLENYDDTEIKKDIENKVDKEEGKGLSTNDFDNDYKEKLDKLNNYDDTKIKEDIAKNTENITKNAEKITKNTENITKNTDALTKANNKIAELEATVALQDEQIPKRNRRRRKHNANR